MIDKPLANVFIEHYTIESNLVWMVHTFEQEKVVGICIIVHGTAVHFTNL